MATLECCSEPDVLLRVGHARKRRREDEARMNLHRSLLKATASALQGNHNLIGNSDQSLQSLPIIVQSLIKRAGEQT